MRPWDEPQRAAPCSEAAPTETHPSGVGDTPQTRPAVFLEMTLDGAPIGTLVIDLYTDLVPKCARAFMKMCCGGGGGGGGGGAAVVASSGGCGGGAAGGAAAGFGGGGTVATANGGGGRRRRSGTSFSSTSTYAGSVVVGRFVRAELTQASLTAGVVVQVELVRPMD